MGIEKHTLHMPENRIVQVKNLTLRVPMFKPNERHLLKNPIGFLGDLYFNKTKREMTTILDDVSFNLEMGQRLGLIGPNGAGKSTLLRTLASIYSPTSGEVQVRGTVKGLFDIALGMNQEATGLENIYLRGLQMGLKLNDIRALIPDIVDFADLEASIDNPFHTYSTGMRMRLAFSISTIVEPDLLLLDEWIGAGDAGFREKVKSRMDQLIANSRGLILATHNNGLMKSLCTHGLVISQGKILFLGDIKEALDFYHVGRTTGKIL